MHSRQESIPADQQNESSRITPAQQRKIHALKQELNLDDTAYRSLLSAWHSLSGKPIESSLYLTRAQASAVIKTLEWKMEQTPQVRRKIYASEKQLRMIHALWRNVSRAHDEKGIHESLRAFLKHHFHVSDHEHIPKKKVPKIVKALTEMKQSKDVHTPVSQ